MSETNKISMTSRVKALFSINHYDQNGERLYKGVYLHLNPHGVILRFDSVEDVMKLSEDINAFLLETEENKEAEETGDED